MNLTDRDTISAFAGFKRLDLYIPTRKGMLKALKMIWPNGKFYKMSDSQLKAVYIN